eukprot:6280681-Pyramimonas_sp.AAC.1
MGRGSWLVLVSLAMAAHATARAMLFACRDPARMERSAYMGSEYDPCRRNTLVAVCCSIIRRSCRAGNCMCRAAGTSCRS